ncbi:3-methyl-2-oxobutanoate hydroxymethyltransferase [Sinorhizobium fredii]|uniref:3-methyl-2-oxobutanoate hydroxymethyltransferase n=1 Tax=Rhizobium fredii TaxID=380 RepID=UPI003B39FDD9
MQSEGCRSELRFSQALGWRRNGRDRVIPFIARDDLRHGPCGAHAAAGERLRRYRSLGRTDKEAENQTRPLAISQSGAFLIVVEGIIKPLAREITESCPIPTIGIGASPSCDGQVLLMDDILGVFIEFKPRLAAL